MDKLEKKRERMKVLVKIAHILMIIAGISCLAMIVLSFIQADYLIGKYGYQQWSIWFRTHTEPITIHTYIGAIWGVFGMIIPFLIALWIYIKDCKLDSKE